MPEDEDKDKGKVVYLFPEEPLLEQRWVGPGPSCMHSQALFNASTRRCWCRDCEAELDPYTVLQRCANEIDWSAQRRAKHLLLKELDQLTKEVQNLKAQRRRAKKGLEELPARAQAQLLVGEVQELLREGQQLRREVDARLDRAERVDPRKDTR